METIIHSQQSESRINETTETDFNSTLLDDGTLFSSHTVNTLIDFEDNHQNNNTTTKTTENTNIYQNHQHRQPVNSNELTKNSNPLNTTIPQLPNGDTPLPRLHRQSSLHFNTQPIILNNSTHPTQGANENVPIAPQQLENSHISAAHITYNSNHVRHTHRGLMDSLKIVTPIEYFSSHIPISQYETWSHKVKVFAVAFNSV